ncbi:MAG: hypothetical protein ACQEWV_06655 [Bacillota bacterium]
MKIFKTANIYLVSLLIAELQTAEIDLIEKENKSITFYITYDLKEHSKANELFRGFRTGTLEVNINNYVSVANDIVYISQLIREKDHIRLKNYRLKSNKLKEKSIEIQLN